MNLFKTLIDGITDEKIFKRICWLYIILFGILLFAIVASYYLFPEGFLRGKHPVASQLELSPNLFISMLQIFAYNLIPTGLIMASSLLAQQSKVSKDRFVPMGYLAFWVVVLLLAVYVGTWSFDIVTAAPPLQDRLLQVFDIFHHSGILELSAYLMAAATSYKFTLWYSDGRSIIRSRKREEIKLDTPEKICLLLVFILLICAALIESYNIVQLAAS